MGERERAICRGRSVPCRIVVTSNIEIEGMFPESNIEIQLFQTSTLDDRRRMIHDSIGIPADHIELFRFVPPSVQITEQLRSELQCWPLCRMTVMLKVNIAMINGVTNHVQVPVHATVLDVMREIWEHTGLWPDQQRLCYGRFRLRRNELLTEYSIDKDPNVGGPRGDGCVARAREGGHGDD